MTERYTVRIARLAETDLLGIVEYIADELHEPDTARNQYLRIKAGIMKLDETPTRIALVRDQRLAQQGYRVLRLDNYHIFLVIEDAQKVVTIVRILYAKRDWSALLYVKLNCSNAKISLVLGDG